MYILCIEDNNAKFDFCSWEKLVARRTECLLLPLFRFWQIYFFSNIIIFTIICIKELYKMCQDIEFVIPYALYIYIYIKYIYIYICLCLCLSLSVSVSMSFCLYLSIFIYMSLRQRQRNRHRDMRQIEIARHKDRERD